MNRDEPDERGRSGAADDHEVAQARLSDYYEGLLGEAEAEAVASHLQACAACRADYRELEEAVGVLAGLGRQAAPERFEKDVEETIHRRSAGRFFGRRAFGDRIPYEVLAIVAVALGLAVYGMLRASETGSLSPRGGEVEEPAGAPAEP